MRAIREFTSWSASSWAARPPPPVGFQHAALRASIRCSPSVRNEFFSANQDRHLQSTTQFMNDLRFALRQLRKSPGFTFVAVLTLALGIGANTAIFTVVHAVLLAPLPFPDADRIVAVQSRNLQENLTREALAPAGFRELEKQATSFESIAASRYNYDNLTRVEKPTTVTASLVTQGYFRVLAERALIGRTFTREDAAANAKPAVVLSSALWQ